MEGNDLGTYDGAYYVVVLEPTLVAAPPPGRYTEFRMRRGSQRAQEAARDARMAEYRINALMVRWIRQQGFQHSIKTEVWGIGNPTLHDDLCAAVEELVGEYVFNYERFDSALVARERLISDPRIHTIYDADEHRVDHYWKMRGYKVPLGGTP